MSSIEEKDFLKYIINYRKEDYVMYKDFRKLSKFFLYYIYLFYLYSKNSLNIDYSKNFPHPTQIEFKKIKW